LRLGIIGHGVIAKLAFEAISAAPGPRALEAIFVLARPAGADRASQLLDAFGVRLAAERRVMTSVADLVAARPDCVAEAAGHAALAAAGVAVLDAGCDLLVTSVGALADDRLREALEQAARRSGARVTISPGAVGGLDILAAAKLSGLSEVVYSSRKPPAAWIGTAAEKRVALAALTCASVFFEGSAREAARDYPQNANVAATIALTGLGLDATRVKLIADPSVTRNVHMLSIRARCADIDIEIAGNPSPDNPKTSMTAGYALARHVLAFGAPFPT
jgi:aspartate dehydrogenase